MTESLDTPMVDYHIIFKSSDSKMWLMRYLDPYFQHCYAVKESAGGQFWIVTNFRGSHTEVYIEAKENYHTIRDLCPDCTIVHFRAKIDPGFNVWSLCVFNCVEQCKALLGIKSFWTWTPLQLYRLITEGQS